MGELIHFPNKEQDMLRNLASLLEQYFPEDIDFVKDMDFEDALGFMYGQLLEIGEDPEVILAESGLIEVDHEV